MENKAGGPAFPNQISVHPNGDIYQDPCPGMTIRDYFAAKALNGLLSGSKADRFFQGDYNTQLAVAHEAYHYADAMIKARSLTDGKAG